MTRTAIITGGILLTGGLVGFILSSERDTGATETTNVTWVSFDEAVNLAKTQNKKILIDVYTDWCTWCKKMDKEVYSHSSVAEVLSSRFITVKLNAESSARTLSYNGRTFTEQEFATGAGVTGYPTTIFLDAKANPITLLPGFVPADKFVPILKFIGDDHYQKISFEEYQKRGSSGQ